MRLIIDVSEDAYGEIVSQVANGITNPLKICIANGTPIPDNATNGYEKGLSVIEDIRAEIEHEGAMFPDGEFFVSIDRINEIIDKHTK